MSFATLVEEIKKLPLEDKIELKYLIEKYVIEERRNKIYKNYKKSLMEAERGELEFSDDVDELKLVLNGKN
jgi:hypothetical protein